MEKRRWPVWGWIGLALIATIWPLNWGLPGLRTHLLFCPLWTGFILTVDALVFVRKGNSLLSRTRWAFLAFYLISAPVWWLFELLNVRTQNWHYVGREFFSDLEYAVLASIAFSTVIPAVFEAAELVSTWKWVRSLKPGQPRSCSKRCWTILFISGWLMLLILYLWPRYGFPLLWISLYAIIEPINAWLGHRTIMDDLSKGDWRAVISLLIGVEICAFFWEFWNYWAYPKWVYTVPFVDFWHIFEMPFLGYGGYLPFSLELYAIYHLITGILRLSHLHQEPRLTE